MMMPATLSIIRVTFTDERERGFAIGIWGSVSAGGAGLGPYRRRASFRAFLVGFCIFD